MQSQALDNIQRMLKTEINIEIGTQKVMITCDNKCRLISHLLHKANMDIHCNKDGLFIIDIVELPTLLNAFDVIYHNPQWIVEFVEKYIDNDFMIKTTFKASEIEA